MFDDLALHLVERVVGVGVDVRLSVFDAVKAIVDHLMNGVYVRLKGLKTGVERSSTTPGGGGTGTKEEIQGWTGEDGGL